MMLGVVNVHFRGLGLHFGIRDNYHDVRIGGKGIDNGTKARVAHFHPLELGLRLATTELELFDNIANLFVPMRIKVYVPLAVLDHLIVIGRTGRLRRIFRTQIFVSPRRTASRRDGRGDTFGNLAVFGILCGRHVFALGLRNHEERRSFKENDFIRIANATKIVEMRFQKGNIGNQICHNFTPRLVQGFIPNARAEAFKMFHTTGLARLSNQSFAVF
mmetsp:Transcript_16990/g.34203  ORF Transcript_16990/g.34203 Transcript_16990/m.34203 type:complete len:217 (-) Transcript_16990:729-1379(-)